MKKITSLIMLFVVGYFLNFISGNIIVTIIGCLLLGIMLQRRNKPSASKPLSFTPPQVTTLQCRLCGETMTPGSEFCRKCGSPMKESLMVVSGRYVTEAIPLAGERGTPLKVCPFCGSELGAVYEFCIKCGRKLSS